MFEDQTQREPMMIATINLLGRRTRLGRRRARSATGEAAAVRQPREETICATHTINVSASLAALCQPELLDSLQWLPVHPRTHVDCGASIGWR